MQMQSFSPEIQKKHDAWQKKRQEADAEILRTSERVYQPLWQARSEFVAEIPGFWAQAVANCEPLSVYIDNVDSDLFEKLKEVKVTRGSDDPRSAKIEFIFEDNKFLADNHLVKEFTPKEDAEPLGSTDFDWETDLVPQPTTIKWKSDDVNLAKKKPTVPPKQDDEDSFEPGSFFSSLFDSEVPAVSCGIAEVVAAVFYPSALEWYTGEAIGAIDSDDYDSEEDEEEDDDDEEEEINLEDDSDDDEKPKKKAKTA